MDVLSDLCRSLRLSGEVYFRANFGGAWGVEVPPSGQEVRFHLCLEGGCRVAVGRQHACDLTRGDLVLVPHGAAQILFGHTTGTASDAGSARAPLPLQRALDVGFSDGELHLLGGTTEPDTRLLCGFCRFDDLDRHPLLTGLPPLIHLRQEDLASTPWISDALHSLTLEARQLRPGLEAVASRLVEVLFIQAIRDLATRPELAGDSFMGALADPRLSRSLAAIHDAPAEPWTVSTLAREAGLSRSRFAQVFAATTGMTPMGYLRQWRLLCARRLLHETRLSIESIARRVGYHSVPSFTRRFGAAFGTTPAAMRRAAAGS
ncbi:MAG: AraC family transcriptional regulator [Acidobacteriota bacterium]